MGYTGFVTLTENRSMSGKKFKVIERDLNVLDLHGSPGEVWREGSSSSCRFPRPLVCNGVDNPSRSEHYFYCCYKKS